MGISRKKPCFGVAKSASMVSTTSTAPSRPTSIATARTSIVQPSSARAGGARPGRSHARSKTAVARFTGEPPNQCRILTSEPHLWGASLAFLDLEERPLGEAGRPRDQKRGEPGDQGVEVADDRVV